MKLPTFTTFLLSVLLSMLSLSVRSQVYLNPNVPTENRVSDLISRMTLEEKIGQMCQYLSPEQIKSSEAKFNGKIPSNNDTNATYPNVSIDSIYHLVEKGLIGSFLMVVTPKESNQLQQLALKSRLKIPIIFGIDAIHGAGYSIGTTIYPTSITLASGFDTKMVEKAFEESALEIRAMGSSWAFTPNVDVCRDPRWGRIGETFGEDPYLIYKMGMATVKGLQGDHLGPYKVAACLKHLVGGGQPNNGLNASPVEISPYTLNDIYLYPFRKIIEETNVSTIMPAHNEVNGIPSHANEQLLNNLFRDSYKFKGFYVSDWQDMERIASSHNYAENVTEAYYESVNAGVDMHMHGPGFLEGMVKLVKENRVSEQRINEACSRILSLKFNLGLFENPLTNLDNAAKVVFIKAHQNTSQKLAEESIVLLKNTGLLPLDFSKYKHILVTGPNADSQAILGDWVLKQPEANVTTIVKGLEQIAGKEKINFYNIGTNVLFDDKKLVNNAVDSAKKSDLAIVVVGEDPMRSDGKLATSGENRDRLDLNLLGLQEDLVERIYATGVPTIVVLVGGRPLSINWISANVPAIVQAWEPGSFGGIAVANVLSGKVNPSGKLPVTIPRSVGQIQMVYNYKPSQYFQKYIDGESTPLYPFGFGLSYTKFKISNINFSKKIISTTDSIEVSADIANVGSSAGSEVIQLYIHDLVSQPTRPVKELKDFSKVFLQPGEKKSVHFTITPEKLSFTKKNMKWGVDPGDFDIMIGTSSQDKDLKKIRIIVK